MDAVLQLLTDGLLRWRPWQIVAYTAATTHMTIIAVTIYLHRCQAHHALDLHPAVSHALRFWLWLATGMVTREWVAVHRKHHAHCEKPGDPHSPQLFGIRKVLLEGTELYRMQATDPATVQRFGKGTPDDWIERHVYARLHWQGVGLLLLADVAMFGVIGLSVWGVQMLWIPVTAAGIVNGLGHYLGYRNFDGPTAAVNIIPFGIAIGGEELHNNHHTFPTSAKLSARWFEFDIGWFYIRLLHALGLAHVRALPPGRPAGRRACAGFSVESLTRISAGRHHLMRDYGLMLVRAFRAELRQAGVRTSMRVRRQAERLLRREPDYLSADQQTELARLLDPYLSLQRIQAMRRELRRLWEARDASPQEALRRLVDWCERAERSEVPQLRTFASELRAYV